MGNTGAPCITRLALAPAVPLKLLPTNLYRVEPGDASIPISFMAPDMHILSAQITLTVQKSIIILAGLLNSGYNLLLVSAHSLRASGAMAPNSKMLAKISSKNWVGG